MSVDALAKLVPPPEKPVETGTAKGWAKVERELGVRLPSDYREYITRYGSGSIGDFIFIHNPFTANQYLNLLKKVPVTCSNMREFNEQEVPEDNEFPYGIYPNSPGLLPFATDAAGKDWSWLTKGPPDTWPVILTGGRDPDYQPFKYTLTNFLCKALRRKIKCRIWPKDFPPPAKRLVFNRGYEPPTAGQG